MCLACTQSNGHIYTEDTTIIIKIYSGAVLVRVPDCIKYKLILFNFSRKRVNWKNIRLEELLGRLKSTTLKTRRNPWRPSRQNNIQHHVTAKFRLRTPKLPPKGGQPTLECGLQSWPDAAYRSILLILIVVNKRYHLLLGLLLLLKELILNWTLFYYDSRQIQGLRHEHLIDPVEVASPNLSIGLAQWRSHAQALTARNLGENNVYPSPGFILGSETFHPSSVSYLCHVTNHPKT